MRKRNNVTFSIIDKTYKTCDLEMKLIFIKRRQEFYLKCSDWYFVHNVVLYHRNFFMSARGNFDGLINWTSMSQHFNNKIFWKLSILSIWILFVLQFLHHVSEIKLFYEIKFIRAFKYLFESSEGVTLNCGFLYRNFQPWNCLYKLFLSNWKIKLVIWSFCIFKFFHGITVMFEIFYFEK